MGGYFGAFKMFHFKAGKCSVKAGAFDAALGFVLDPVDQDNLFATLSKMAPKNKMAQVLLGGLSNDDTDEEWQRRLKNAGISCRYR